MTTIQDLSRPSSEPYVKPLKVKVARISPHGWSHYIMANGQACSKLTCMLADQTGYIRCEVFGEKFQSNFVEGKSIALRNYVINHGVLRVTSQTKVFCLSNLPVSENIVGEATQVFYQPISPVKKIQNVKASPLKSKVSFTGDVTSDETVRTVQTKGASVDVRNVTISDDTGSLRVALWQECAKVPLSTGTRVTIKDATLSVWNKLHTVSVNDVNAIQINEAEEVVKEMTISAIQQHEHHISVLDRDDDEYDASLDDLLQSMKVETFHDAVQQLPHECQCVVIRNKIVRFMTSVNTDNLTDQTEAPPEEEEEVAGASDTGKQHQLPSLKRHVD